MRADRLLSMLMLLQSRGRMTAKALASQLEVSERTVYRDVDALSAAGVPIYGEPGREGGFALIDSYRTSLTGMTDGELQALFSLSIPGPLAELGLGQDLRAALLKLAASLPDGRRSLAGMDRLRIHIDATAWDQGEGPVPHLQTLYKAVRQDRRGSALPIARRFRSGSNCWSSRTGWLPRREPGTWCTPAKVSCASSLSPNLSMYR